jgi:hypothetical protein
MLAPIPTLDQVASEGPACLRGLQPDALLKLLARVAAAQSSLAAQLLLTNTNNGREPSEPDTMLTVAEAAKLLRRTPRWVWRHQSYSFVRRISNRNLLISKNDLTKWLSMQTVTRKSHTRGAA